MARFAPKAAASAQIKTVNEAGGDAFLQSPRLALASLALTSVVIDSAYRSGASEMVALTDLLDKLQKKGDLKFAAQTALYARHTHGMRTISHVIAGEIALRKGEFPWRTSFFDKVIKRPDDAIEIASYVRMKLGAEKMLPNALKRGLAKALTRFDEYSIAKYDKDREGLSLITLVNLVHPKVNDKHAIHKLMKGTIKQAMTWENELSEAGKEKDPAKAKAAVWKRLFKEKQLGYMACLMNLRNIAEQAPKSVDDAIELLTDESQVKKALIMPTQFIAAYKAMQEIHTDEVQDILNALNKAIEIAMSNVPKFSGRTLVALDASGSMNQAGSFKFTPFEIGALFAAVLYKANAKCDFMYFADEAKYVTIDRNQKLLPLRDEIIRKRISGGTNFHVIFRGAAKAYDRIVILSDMQAWMKDGAGVSRAEEGTSVPAKAYKDYCKLHDADPNIYTFDLKSAGTSQFPTNKVFALAGWTDKVFDIMARLEVDKNALVHEIEAVNV